MAQRSVAASGDRRQFVAELLDEHLDLRGRIDAHHVVGTDVDPLGIGRHRTGENHRMEREFELGHRLRQIGLVRLAEREQELLLLVLDEQFDQIGERTVGKRNFTLAVDDVFLQVERHGLRLADVLHRFGNGDTRLLANTEKAVDGRARRENYGRMIQYLDPLLPELLERNARYPNERMIIDGYALSARQFEERRLFGDSRLRLRDKNSTDFRYTHS